MIQYLKDRDLRDLILYNLAIPASEILPMNSIQPLLPLGHPGSYMVNATLLSSRDFKWYDIFKIIFLFGIVFSTEYSQVIQAG